MTKEATEVLISGSESMEQVKSLLKTTTLFPELNREEIVQFLSRPAGGVVLFNTECGELEEARNESDASVKKRNMMWVRLIAERVGEEEVSILVFSPISIKSAGEYYRIYLCVIIRIAMSKYGNLLFSRTGSEEVVMMPNGPAVIRRHQNTSSRGLPTLAPESDAMSVSSSIASLDQDDGLTVSQLDLFTHELQSNVASKATPVLVKRLALFLVGFLAVVVVLISVESAEFISETSGLKERFQMIEYYQIRYELLIYMAMSPYSYVFYRLVSASSFTSYCTRTRSRVARALQYNVLTRLSFSKLGLNYDYENIQVVLGTSTTYTVSFYYAFLTVFDASWFHRAIVHQQRDDLL